MWQRERIRPGRRLDSLVLTVFLKVLHSIVQLGFSPTQRYKCELRNTYETCILT